MDPTLALCHNLKGAPNALLCVWWLSLSGKDGCPVWVGRLSCWLGFTLLFSGTPLKRAHSCSLHYYILGNLWLCYVLFPSLTVSLPTHTHTLFVKDKGVPPTTLSHVILVLTYSDICSIKTSSHTVLISYWQREVNVPTLLCFNWLDENFQTLLMSYNLISIRASLHQSNALLEPNNIFQANK